MERRNWSHKRRGIYWSDGLLQ